MSRGTINGFRFQATLEPDGKGSHWLKVDNAVRKAIGADEVDAATLAIEPIKKWPEPKVPDDLKKAISADQQANNLWTDITPNARWDWIRWINATKDPEIRSIRIEKTLSNSNQEGEQHVASNVVNPPIPKYRKAEYCSNRNDRAT